MKKNDKQRKRSRSELIISSTILIVLGCLTGYYYLGSKKTIFTADTLLLSGNIYRYWFDACIKRGTGYSDHCLYFKLDPYTCDLKASSIDLDKAEQVFMAKNTAVITIEKSEAGKLMTNKTIQVLSLEINGQNFRSASDGIKNRNIFISYLLPALSLLLLFFGFKDLNKLRRK